MMVLYKQQKVYIIYIKSRVILQVHCMISLVLVLSYRLYYDPELYSQFQWLLLEPVNKLSTDTPPRA